MLRKAIVATVICITIPLLSGELASATNLYTLSVNALGQEVIDTQRIQLQKIEESQNSYQNIGISIANSYVNIRKEPNIDSEVVGKLYEGSAATITKVDGKWAGIKSGKVSGFIFNEYLATGQDAKKLIDKYGLKLATVNTTTLRVRDDMNIKSRTVYLVPEGSSYTVLSEYEGWVKIQFEGHEGYVAKKYVKISYEFESAISIEEEKERLMAERMSRADNQKSKVAMKIVSKDKNEAKEAMVANQGTIASQLVSYSIKFVGNPYVLGGTSLTDGADCSGYVQTIYKKFGVRMPRTSRQQAKVGTKVSTTNMKVGDLIFYASEGTVNHVAIYMGNGQVVHASNPDEGIKISNYNYRTPYSVRRVLQ